MSGEYFILNVVHKILLSGTAINMYGFLKNPCFVNKEAYMVGLINAPLLYFVVQSQFCVTIQCLLLLQSLTWKWKILVQVLVNL